jgi:hypothetical protein
MMRKLIDFIIGLFCKKCVIKAEAAIVKPSRRKKEDIDKKKNLDKLAAAIKKKKSNGN